MEVPAAMDDRPGADRQKVEDVVERLAERLGIPTPELQADYVFLPVNYVTVAEALDEVEPGWRDETLITPPEP
jgi:hypothetical protein